MMPTTIRNRIRTYLRDNPSWHTASTISSGAGITEDEFADNIDYFLRLGEVSVFCTKHHIDKYRLTDLPRGYHTTRYNRIVRYLTVNPGWHTASDIAKHLNLKPVQVAHLIRSMPDNCNIETDAESYPYKYKFVN